jgi:hypothetical protein
VKRICNVKSDKKGLEFELTRRRFLNLGMGASLALILCNEFTFAANKTPRKKLLNIIVPGGWDTALTTDPVTDAKLSLGQYESVYRNKFGIHTPNGKTNLKCGEGLVNALRAFELLPTCFVNGVYMEVSAHEIALNYALSGVRSLSRSREYPCTAALLGTAGESYPPHVVLGKMPPLGNTRFTSPPLQAKSIGMLSAITQGPSADWIKSSNVEVAQQLIRNLDLQAQSTQSTAQKAALSPWTQASTGVETLYARNLSPLLGYTSEIKQRYLGAEDWTGPGTLAGAFLTLKSGLSSNVTVSFAGEFDSHSDHLARHLPSLTLFAKALTILTEDLVKTPDPDDNTKSLADTTLILIQSEFSRTPKFNSANGTDHWQSASAILMGAGVKDNTVVGSTGNDAKALGWAAGTATGLTLETALLPEHLISAVLQNLGFLELSQSISQKPMGGVFT